MSIDLTKQVLYSCHVSPDNRYADGVFETSIVDNILTVSFRSIINRATFNYQRTIPTNDFDPTPRDVAIASTSFPFYIVIYKVLTGALGLERLKLDTSDSMLPNPHTKSSWSFDLTEYNLDIGDVIKVMVCGVLPNLENVFYNGGDVVIDAQEWKANGHSNAWRVPFDSPIPFAFNGDLEDESNPFEMIFEKGLPFDPGELIVQDFAYALYSMGLDKSIHEWFSHVIGSENSGTPTVPLNRIQRIECNQWRVYLADAMTVDTTMTISVSLYGSRTIVTIPITTEDLVNGYYYFNVLTDGIYEIVGTISTVGSSTTYRYYFFEYCQIEQCYLKLLDDIYCHDVDCCSGCDDDMLRERAFKRSELAKLRMFMDEISFGIIYLNGSSSSDMLEKLVLYYARIQEITSRCGTCSDTSPVTSPCNNCG